MAYYFQMLLSGAIKKSGGEYKKETSLELDMPDIPKSGEGLEITENIEIEPEAAKTEVQEIKPEEIEQEMKEIEAEGGSSTGTEILEGAGASEVLEGEKAEGVEEVVTEAEKLLETGVDVVEKTVEIVNGGEIKEGTAYVDADALKHSSVGDFTYNPRTGDVSRMKGGGYGQANIDFLENNGIEYNIVKEYDNGVRVGNIPKHKTPSKRIGIGQAWFPKDWSENKIKVAGEFVANLPDNLYLSDGIVGYGEYDGVRIGVIKTNGKIGTIFPDSVQ